MGVKLFKQSVLDVLKSRATEFMNIPVFSEEEIAVEQRQLAEKSSPLPTYEQSPPTMDVQPAAGSGVARPSEETAKRIRESFQNEGQDADSASAKTSKQTTKSAEAKKANPTLTEDEDELGVDYGDDEEQGVDQISPADHEKVKRLLAAQNKDNEDDRESSDDKDGSPESKKRARQEESNKIETRKKNKPN